MKTNRALWHFDNSHPTLSHLEGDPSGLLHPAFEGVGNCIGNSRWWEIPKSTETTVFKKILEDISERQKYTTVTKWKDEVDLFAYVTLCISFQGGFFPEFCVESGVGLSFEKNRQFRGEALLLDTHSTRKYFPRVPMGIKHHLGKIIGSKNYLEDSIMRVDDWISAELQKCSITVHAINTKARPRITLRTKFDRREPWVTEVKLYDQRQG
jgi:hypothetical protein